MKKLFVALIVLIALIQNSFASEFPGLSAEQREKIKIIWQVKLFEKEIGLKETDNFTRFANVDSRNMFLCIAELSCMPFSMHDPQMAVIYGLGQSDSREDFIRAAKRIGITDYDDYDYLFVEAMATAGNSPITRKLLDQNTARTLAEVVIHEDFHNNLPMCANIGEAAARIVGIAGACKFLNYNREEEDSDIAITKNSFDRVNEHFEYLTKLCDLFNKGRLSREEFLRLRRARFAGRYLHSYHSRIKMKDHVSEISNVLGVSLMHTYSNYFPLMLRLYKALDRDLSGLVSVLRRANERWPSPNFMQMSRGEYFLVLREREESIARYLESVINSKKR